MNPAPPLTRKCRRCHRPLRGVYAVRALGPVCGGRITKGRKPATPVHDDVQHRAVPVMPGQLSLIDELEAA